MATSLSTSTTDEQLDTDEQKSIVAATRLWQQTRHMKATILDKCRLYLKSIDANVQVNNLLEIPQISLFEFFRFSLMLYQL
jgi:hypothetical protein